MTKIFVARHAESIANTEGIYQGQTYDTDLSALGEKQALALSNYMKEIPVKKIIASPLRRTMQTALKVADTLGLEVQKSEEIIETNHGVWEGKNKEWIQNSYPKEWKTWQEKPGEVVFPKGEAYIETYNRVFTFVKQQKWDENTLVVTHDNIVRIMLCIANNVDLNKIWAFDIDPAAITEFEIDDSTKDLSLIKENETSFLSRLKSDMRNHAL